MALSDEAAARPAQAGPAKGRPSEIEERLNLALIHPLSRRLVTLLIPTGVSPNMVSATGVAVAAMAAAAYWAPWRWPLAALAGFALHLGWHVLDGADGDLARRTGRSSPSGEVVDGVCDYLSHVVIYVVLAMVLARQPALGAWGPRLGGWAWVLAAVAGASRAVQANHYESSRRTYLWWVHGVPWIRQDAGSAEGPAGASLLDRARLALAGGYLAVSRLVTADDTALEPLRVRLLGSPRAQAARDLYAAAFRPLVKQASLLGALHETQAIFLSMLAGSPLYVFVYEIVALNLLMVVSIRRQARRTRDLVARLEMLD